MFSGLKERGAYVRVSVNQVVLVGKAGLRLGSYVGAMTSSGGSVQHKLSGSLTMNIYQHAETLNLYQHAETLNRDCENVFL